ncbi:MAG: cation diffusion facilitator family transporter [Gammaproteobacteria bacterium]|nr:cation diffusion facilitator family transporter [Gammaproteobacteria bacterium]
MTAHHHSTELLDTRYREVRKVTLVGSVVDLLLGIAKIMIGIPAHSQALVADGVHSLSDLGTDVLVLYAAKQSHRVADEEHPYGHGRIETVATVALGMALTAVAMGITYDAVRRMLDPELLLRPEMPALIVALISILSKEAIYRYTARAARRLRSKMLHANAWHSRSDAISSIVVVIGVGGAMAGLPYLDAVAAVAVALMIAKIGWDLLWESLQELIDTALDSGQVEDIRESIMGVPGVRELHMLRTRRSGSDALVDVHILVDPILSVSEGHQIGESVRARLLKEIDAVTDVTVHIDPEDDEVAAPCIGLPLRDAIQEQLDAQLAELDIDVAMDQPVLHYLGGKVHVDIILPLAGLAPGAAREIAARLVDAAQRVPDVGEVKVYFKAQ